MRMRVACMSDGLRDCKTVCVLVKLARGANIVVRTVILAMAVATLVPESGWTQSGDDSKPPAPTQSSKQVPPSVPDAQTSLQPPQSVMRTVTVKFDYDFTKFPPCSAKITKKCVKQFNVYEVSGNKPIFLFSIPVPPNAKGKVVGISGSAPQRRAFFTGPHRFGVSAKGRDPNYESSPYGCVTFAQVLPDNPMLPTSSNSPPKN